MIKVSLDIYLLNFLSNQTELKTEEILSNKNHESAKENKKVSLLKR